MQPIKKILNGYAINIKEWPFDMVVIDALFTFKSPKSQGLNLLKEITTHS